MVLSLVILYLGLGCLIFLLTTALGAKAWVVIGALLLVGSVGLLLVMGRMNRED